ncbi:type II toxin-antitoxin system RelE/ParE family toxin [Actinobacillus porcinus]|uniref:type II toxin-antitoxin system RelE/ParE family toxin n=1 Tax=Actinobacillus porcinus TaxID=51048 RepID=UPI002354CED2|nr:type II toxin-antitoxin system RelE/ParE family toxin [Actinobacillus porcinus]
MDAVERANQGLIDANLGGNVIKQRIAKQGQGKSSGYRSLILYRINNNSYFVAAIEKSDRENISEQEENALKLLAKVYETYREEQINALVKQGILIEITLPK